MKPAPLLAERSTAVQVTLAAIVPAILGAVTGIFLGVSEGVYLLLSIVAFIGGIGAGFDHDGAAAGAKRGLLSGVIFGAFVLIAHEIHGAEPKADLPEPAISFVIVTGVLGVLLGALGGFLRARLDRTASR